MKATAAPFRAAFCLPTVRREYLQTSDVELRLVDRAGAATGAAR